MGQAQAAREAWALERAELAERRLVELARALEAKRPAAAARQALARGEMAMRWTAAGMLDAERSSRRVKGFRELPQLAAALHRHAVDVDEQEVKDFPTAA